MSNTKTPSFSFLVDDDEEGLVDIRSEPVQSRASAPSEDVEFHPVPIVPSKTTTQSSGRIYQPMQMETSETSGAGGSSWLRLTSYSSYFDVTAEDVWRRIKCVLLPWKGNFLAEMEHPDLYGPVWIAVTLVVCISISSELHQQFLDISGIKGNSTSVQFHHLVLAFTVILSYVFLGSSAVWAIRRYYGIESELVCSICIYGYSMAPLTVAEVLSVTPLKWFNLTFFLAGWCLSSLFLYRNFWSVGTDDSLGYYEALNWRKAAPAIALGSSLVHAGLGVFVWLVLY